MSKHTEQAALERESTQLGVTRRRERNARARAKGRASQCPAERDLMAAALAAVTEGVTAWRRKDGRRPGVGRTVAPLIRSAPPAKVAFLALRACFDIAVGGSVETRSRSSTSVAHAISGLLEDEVTYGVLQRTMRQQWQALWRGTKRSGHPYRRRAARAIAREMGSWAPWSQRERLTVGFVLLDVVVRCSGAFRLVPIVGPRGRKMSAVVLTDEAARMLTELEARHELMNPVLQPMVVVPRPFGPQQEGGYVSNELAHKDPVSVHRRRYQREVADGVPPEVFAALNAVSGTAWAVNEGVLEVLSHLWEAGSEVAGLPAKDPYGMPPRPPDIATNEAARRAWKRAAAKTHTLNAEVAGVRSGFVRSLWVARKFRGRRVWFPHFADFRGRMYPMPPYLSPQGSEVARGLLQFADPKPLGERGMTWLARHGAGCWGHGVDRLPWSGREAWAHSPEIVRVCRDTAHDELDTISWWSSADKPWSTLAWAREWGQALEEGPAFQSRLPVTIDGSNNGLQIYSLLTRDEVGGTSTNCVPGPAPRDIYQDVADQVRAALDGPFDDPRHAAWASAWRRHFCGTVPREAVKRSVMTLPYGATKYACQRYVREWFEGSTKDLMIFGADGVYRPCYWLAGLVWDAIGLTVGRARDCMDWLHAVSDAHADAGIPVRWWSPSGFPVVQDYVKTKTKRLKLRIGDRIRYPRYKGETDAVDGKKSSNGIAPNWVHSIDAACLVHVVNAMAEQVPGCALQVVHDSFGTHAADAARLSVQVRASYRQVFEADLLTEAFEQFNLAIPGGIPDPPGWRGNLDLRELDRSDYFFA